MNCRSPNSIYYGSPINISKFPRFHFGSEVMGHFQFDLQTTTSGRTDERYFVGIAHDFNSGIRLYCPINKSTITRHSYTFLDTVNPVAPVYVISDSKPTSIVGSLASPSLAVTVSPSVEEVWPTLSSEVLYDLPS